MAPGYGANNYPTITDDVTSHTVGTASWTAGTDVRFDFDLYACTDRHAPPLVNGNGNVANTAAPTMPGDCTKVSTTSAIFDHDGQQRTIQFIGDSATNPTGGHSDGHFAYSSGKNYYIVSRMEKGKQNGANGYPNSQGKLVDSWYSPFSTTGEQAKTTFSPEVTSVANGAGGSKYITAGTNFVDKITVKPQTAPVVNPSISNADTNPTWLKDDTGAYVKVKACVQAYGPAAGPYATTTGAYAPNTSTDLPTELKTKAIGSPVCEFVSPALVTLGSPAGTVDFTIPTTGWTPGYYYFITTIDGSQQAAGIADYLAGQSNFSYTSPFNPASPQSEWGYIKFQPVARSMMEGNRYSEDKGTTGRGANKGVGLTELTVGTVLFVNTMPGVDSGDRLTVGTG